MSNHEHVLDVELFGNISNSQSIDQGTQNLLNAFVSGLPWTAAWFLTDSPTLPGIVTSDLIRRGRI